ncbi:hypothetical protein EAG_02883 [Camponotus floridanus]|uniref:Zasp-like motif domain-containing protein n=1 Tax=Camponotus floridanus TaxID=104421 RepID=E2AGG3_CAMFO|nr:hypothetical protein EAG_02883 [Camponotus floridanus]
MTTQKARFVNKQFNSPINLYSPQVIQETLDRQTQVLANGAVGIDFNQLAKPANLQNSAVLRMLEEEETRQRGGQPGHGLRVANRAQCRFPHSLAGHQESSKIGSQLVFAIMKGTSDFAMALVVGGCPFWQSRVRLRDSVIKPENSTWESNRYVTYKIQANFISCQEVYSHTLTRLTMRDSPYGCRNGHPLRHTRGAVQSMCLKRVAWPPPPEDQDFDYVEQTPIQAKNYLFSSGKTRGYGDLGSYQSSPTSGPSPQPSLVIAPQSAVPSSPSPVSPGGTLLRQPSHFRQQQTNLKSWTPVTPPATSPLPHQQHPPLPSQQTQPWQQHSQDPYDRTPQKQQNQPGYQSSVPAAFEAPPSTIILRPEPPISQIPAPVYQAQPAATKAPATGNMRGDLKWPPPTIKAQVEAENRARIELAKGPAFRPRRVNKDYSSFFAQHALNSNYPGYRAPPGTQYFTPAYQH